MRYLGQPRWRYLLTPLAFLSLPLALLITFVSLGTVRALAAADDFLEWSLYDR